MEDTDNKPEVTSDIFDDDLIPQEMSTFAVDTHYIGLAEFEKMIDDSYKNIDVEKEEEGS
tara:strand:- start:653 stop:832 length:180 start_codon:yes stop_codon:yes gene_type:complete